MSMTKKDYTALSRILKNNEPREELEFYEDTFRKLANEIANYCKQENPRGFNRHEFMRNCGLEE